jgi:hypothetical protein
LVKKGVSVADGVLAGELGLLCERLLGLAHRLVGRPDPRAALMLGGTGGDLKTAQCVS